MYLCVYGKSRKMYTSILIVVLSEEWVTSDIFVSLLYFIG